MQHALSERAWSFWCCVVQTCKIEQSLQCALWRSAGHQRLHQDFWSSTNRGECLCRPTHLCVAHFELHKNVWQFFLWCGKGVYVCVCVCVGGGGGGGTTVPVPDSDAAGQHTLNGSPVEGGEDGKIVIVLSSDCRLYHFFPFHWKSWKHYYGVFLLLFEQMGMQKYIFVVAYSHCSSC